MTEGVCSVAWIEVHQGLFRHRKTLVLAAALDVHRMSAGAHVISLWLWALDNAPEGDLSHLSPAIISFGAEWEGDPQRFTTALVEAGFLDTADCNQLVIHDWHQYAGRLIDRRKADAERKRVHRTSAGHPPDAPRMSAPTVPYRTVPNPTAPIDVLTPARTREESIETTTEVEGWLQTLQAIEGWEQRGQPHEATLLAWVARSEYTNDQLEGAAIGLAGAFAKTLKGYRSLAAAFQGRVRKGYDAPAGSGNGRVYVQPVSDSEPGLERPEHGPIDRGDDGVWARALEVLRGQVTRPAYETWLAGTVGLGWAGSVLVVGVATEAVGAQLDNRMYGLVSEAVERIAGRDFFIAFDVAPS